MSGKSLPPPGGGAQGLTEMLRARHLAAGGTDQAPETFQTPAPRSAPTEDGEPAAARPAPVKRAGTDMDRRSWYMPKASADALAQAVDDLHWETRQPKHAVLAALIDAALANRDAVAKRLSH